jgi:hypothetical protein
VAANQQIAQLPDALQHAVFGNAGTLIAFRVGALDAKRLAGELGMTNPTALTQMNNYTAWIKLMHHGSPSPARHMRSLSPPPMGVRLAEVLKNSRHRHMKPRAHVEKRIAAAFPKSPPKRGRTKRRRDADRV